MELKFVVETEDLFGCEGIPFEELLKSEMQKEILNNCRKNLKSDKFEKFAKLVEEKLVSEIKVRLENFLSEEILLTGRYGEKNWGGSIEDLIKQRFDDILLRPVDSQGNTLKGCTSKEDTWIEWIIRDKLEKNIKTEIETAGRKIRKEINEEIDDKLLEIKETGIKEKISDIFDYIENNKLS
jgi:hypothetical protein